MEKDKNTNPPPETRPAPESVIERRSMAHTVAESYFDGTAKALGAATVAAATYGVVKAKNALTSKDDGSKVILPPGTKSKD